jgi:hypothetical protein
VEEWRSIATGETNQGFRRTLFHCQSEMIVSKLSGLAFAARVAPNCLRQFDRSTWIIGFAETLPWIRGTRTSAEGVVVTAEGDVK